MGLDQWLVAKTKRKDLNLSNEATGVCSGLFGLTCVLDGEYELGYLRKAYDQNGLIIDNSSPTEEEYNYTFTKEQIQDIIDEAKHILETHEFDEEGYDLSNVGTWSDTWQSKYKWEETIKMFIKAKDVLEQDPDAQIIYKEWF